jgi:hypothetical protein
VTGAGGDALEAASKPRQHGTGVLGGLANHGRGCGRSSVWHRPEAVTSWVETYRQRLRCTPSRANRSRPTPGRRLGDFDRVGDWIGRSTGSSRGARGVRCWPWTKRLGAWWERLSTVSSRTGHATRALARRDTPRRRQERRGEGSPTGPPAHRRLRSRRPAGSRPPSALPDVLLPAGVARSGPGTEGLADWTPFPGLRRCDRSGRPSPTRPCSSQPDGDLRPRHLTRQRLARPSFIHTVTGPSAIRLLLPTFRRTCPVLFAMAGGGRPPAPSRQAGAASAAGRSASRRPADRAVAAATSTRPFTERTAVRRRSPAHLPEAAGDAVRPARARLTIAGFCYDRRVTPPAASRAADPRRRPTSCRSAPAVQPGWLSP